jgi:hypothetical protein
MKNYKSFIGSKLFENLENQQVPAFKKAIEDGIILTDDVSARSLDDHISWDSVNQSIDFDGNVQISYKFNGNSLEDLPFSFGKILGSFNCSGIDSLKNLKGSPTFCYNFDASRCSLRSLEGAPEVCENFTASQNLLRNIKGAPQYIFGDFDVTENMITNLDFGPLIVTGSCRLLGNSTIGIRKVGSHSDANQFSKMHREITYEYLLSSSDLEKMYIKTQEALDKAILNQSYVTTLITKEPEFSKFLGRFKKDLDDLSFIKGVKDFGII